MQVKTEFNKLPAFSLLHHVIIAGHGANPLKWFQNWGQGTCPIPLSSEMSFPNL